MNEKLPRGWTVEITNSRPVQVTVTGTEVQFWGIRTIKQKATGGTLEEAYKEALEKALEERDDMQLYAPFGWVI